MIILLLFGYWSCQSSTKKEALPQKTPKRIYTLSIHSSPSRYKLWQETIQKINERRKYPIFLEKEGRYSIWIERRGGGYLLKLYLGISLIQTARALNEYELPLAVSALIRRHIPDTLKVPTIPQL